MLHQRGHCNFLICLVVCQEGGLGHPLAVGSNGWPMRCQHIFQAGTADLPDGGISRAPIASISACSHRYCTLFLVDTIAQQPLPPFALAGRPTLFSPSRPPPQRANLMSNAYLCALLLALALAPPPAQGARRRLLDPALGQCRSDDPSWISAGYSRYLIINDPSKNCADSKVRDHW